MNFTADRDSFSYILEIGDDVLLQPMSWERWCEELSFIAAQRLCELLFCREEA